MEYKKIIENGYILEVKTINEEDLKIDYQNSITDLLNEQEKLGYVFLKSFKQNGKNQTMFIKNEDYQFILTNQ